MVRPTCSLPRRQNQGWRFLSHQCIWLNADIAAVAPPGGVGVVREWAGAREGGRARAKICARGLQRTGSLGRALYRRANKNLWPPECLAAKSLELTKDKNSIHQEAP